MTAIRKYVFHDGKELELGKRTLVMGVLNVTPDSFSDGGKWNTHDKALRHMEEMVKDGADIIDIGAESSRPGFKTMPAQQEIERLIGRSLRAVVDMKALGERTIMIDCDVIQADGGTRTASITGACVALADALNKLVASGKLKTNPMKGMVAAVSVGIVNGEALCDLEYVEDSAAETDMNVVMTEDGRIIEVQGTAEGEPFSHEELLTLLALARGGIESIVATQKAALEN